MIHNNEQMILTNAKFPKTVKVTPGVKVTLNYGTSYLLQHKGLVELASTG